MLCSVNNETMKIKEYNTNPKAPGLEPHHQMHFSFISRTLIERDLTPLQRCSRCILQPQPLGQPVAYETSKITVLS